MNRKGGIVKLQRELRSLRAKLGMNQTVLARELGMATSTYCMKERGEREFTCSEMAKIVEIGRTVDDKCTMDALFLRQ